jgi:uncharacterized membrane protein YhhN
MVTTLPATLHGPIAVMIGVLVALVVAATENEDLLPAAAGAPVKVTVGAIFVALAEAETLTVFDTLFA